MTSTPTTQLPTLVLLGPSPVTVTHAVRAGCQVVVIDTPGNIAALPPTPAGTVLIGLDYRASTAGDLIATVRAAVPGADLLGVVSLTEYGQLPSAEMNDLLGVKDNPVEAVQRVVHKDLMREALADHPTLAVGHEVVAGIADARRFVRVHGLPVIAKPADGAGSIGVTKVRTDAELAGLQYPLLFEEYLRGPEFSVEAITVDGAHHVLGVTQKILGEPGTPGELIEYGHLFPAPLDPATQSGIKTAVETFLDAVGIVTGLTHTEVIVTPAGVRPVETHVRNGGQHITDLVHMATGVDMVRTAVLIRAGRPITLEPAEHGVAAMLHIDAPPGRITCVTGVDAARYRPHVVDVIVRGTIGSEVRPTTASGEQLGDVMVTAPTAEAALAAARAAVDSIEIGVR